MPLSSAKLTSRMTKREAVAAADKSTTNTLLLSTAATMTSPYSTAGGTSRGAIQHRMPFFSRALQKNNAVRASSTAWLTKTLWLTWGFYTATQMKRSWLASL